MTPLTEIEQARADWRRAANRESRLLAEAEARAAKAVALVKGRRLARGPDHTMKMSGCSSLVHRREPIA